MKVVKTNDTNNSPSGLYELRLPVQASAAGIYGITRNLREIILRMPMFGGEVVVSGRIRLSNSYVVIKTIVSTQNVRAAFLNAFQCPEFFVQSEYCEFSITIQKR